MSFMAKYCDLRLTIREFEFVLLLHRIMRIYD